MKNLNHREETKRDYSCVQLNYANTSLEAQYMLEYYRARGYVFIDYSAHGAGVADPSDPGNSGDEGFTDPFAEYEEDFDVHHVIGREFDRVVMLMDSSFYYDEKGLLQGIPQADPDYLYPNLFYQGITRVREDLALVVVNAPELFDKIVTIL